MTPLGGVPLWLSGVRCAAPPEWGRISWGHYRGTWGLGQGHSPANRLLPSFQTSFGADPAQGLKSVGMSRCLVPALQRYSHGGRRVGAGSNLGLFLFPSLPFSYLKVLLHVLSLSCTICKRRKTLPAQTASWDC